MKRAFLHGKFEKGEKVHMKVPEGWECFYPPERYANDMEYESHKERCANHDVSYNIEYESHKEMCANDVEYESERKVVKKVGSSYRT